MWGSASYGAVTIPALSVQMNISRIVSTETAFALLTGDGQVSEYDE